MTAAHESPGHVNTQAVIVPTERHLALYQLLRSTSRPDRNGELVSWWPQARLALKLGCSVRTLQNVLGDLREPGIDPRHPRRAAGLRLGLIRVVPTTYRDKATGRHRLGGNAYVIVPGQHATLSEPVSAAQVNTQEGGVACLNKKAPADGGYQGVDEGEQDPAPLEPIEIPVEPPEDALLDHDPDVSEILATLGTAFGQVKVLSGPATYRMTSKRLIDLATAPTGDLHKALKQLDKHTCRRVNGNGTERCMPGYPNCGRHTRRRRAR